MYRRKHQKTQDRYLDKRNTILKVNYPCSVTSAALLTSWHFSTIYIFSTESNLPVTSTDAHLPRCSTWDLCLPPTSLCHPWNPSSPDRVEYCGLLERNWDDWWPGGWLLYIPTTGSSYPLCPDQDSHRTENRDMSGWASRSDVWEEHKSIWSCFVFGLLTPSIFFCFCFFSPYATNVTLLNKRPVWVGNTVWSVSWAHFKH